MADNKQPVQVNINLDTTPILYTDNVQMTANEDGVVLNVMQRIGSSNQLRIVARIGMSVVHAKKLAAMLGQFVVNPKGIKQTGPKTIN